MKVYWKNNAEKRNSYYTITLQEIEPFIAAPNTTETEVGSAGVSTNNRGFLKSNP